MDNCEKFQALLDPFVDGELSAQEAAAVQEHLRTCRACQAYVDDALAIRAALSTLEEPQVPPHFAENVMAAVSAMPRTGAPARSGKKPVSHPRRKLLASLAACFALVLLLHGFYGRSETEYVESESAAPESRLAEPADGAAPGADKPSVFSDSYTLESDGEDLSPTDGVFASLTLTAEEAGSLLEGFTPAEEREGETVYLLERADYDALLEALAQAGTAAEACADTPDPQAQYASVIILH